MTDSMTGPMTDSMTGPMTGMVLAAGRGRRLAHLSPMAKPLIEVGGKAMILHALARVRQAGAKKIFVNLHHAARPLRAFLKQAARDVHPLHEPELLDTGGGVRAGLPHLGERFFLSNCDHLWADEPAAICRLRRMRQTFCPAREDAMLLLAPGTKACGVGQGDFACADGLLSREGRRDFIYSGAGIFSARLFCGSPAGAFSLSPLLFAAAAQKRLRGVVLDAPFFHLGVAEGLEAARRKVQPP